MVETSHYSRGRGKRLHTVHRSLRSGVPSFSGQQRERRHTGRPLPSPRDEPKRNYDHGASQPYDRNISSRSLPNNSRPLKVWWSPFGPDRLPLVFQPHKCHDCKVYPSNPWAMVTHLCSIDHCVQVLNASAHGEYDKRLRCEVCLISMRSVAMAKSHFSGWKHQTSLQLLRKDLKHAGFLPLDDERPHSANEAELPRRSSVNEDLRVSLDEYHRNEDERLRKDDERQRRDSRHSQSGHGNNWNKNSYLPERHAEDIKLEESRIKREEVKSKRDELPSKTEDKDVKNRHQFFFSSDEEDENTTVPKTEREDDSTRTESKPKLLTRRAKSIVDKRKDIISRLSNCTDVRDLSKQLRQISRGGGDERQRTTRKALPGLAYTNREIVQQETFAEARAALLMQQESGSGVKTEMNGRAEETARSSPSVKRETITKESVSKETSLKPEVEDCKVVPTPPAPAPQVISDSDEEEQLDTNEETQPSTSASAAPISSNQTSDSNEFGKLAAIVAQERALTEKLQYITQTLPRIESLKNQLSEENRNTIAQLELLRGAKMGLVSRISQEPTAPPGAELYSSGVLLNTLLQPAARQPDNIQWLLGNSSANLSVQSFLQNIGIPPSPAASLSSSQANGSRVDSPAVCEERKRAANNDTPVSSKRTRLYEFDEQVNNECILVVRLCGSHVYTSSRDGVVKRTPLQNGAGQLVMYKHCGQDSKSQLKRVCAHMMEVTLNKKVNSIKVITGSDDCALRVFDGETGHLIKVIPVQAKVICGIINWQKIYIGLKSGFIQVYNVIDQCFIVESKQKQAPKLVTYSEISNCKCIVIVNEDNSALIRDAGNLFVMYAIDKLDQDINSIVAKNDHIVITGKDKIYVFDKSARLTHEIRLDQRIFAAVPSVTSLILAAHGGVIRSFGWKTLFGGKIETSQSIQLAKNAEHVITSVNVMDSSKKLAVATEHGRVTVVDIKTLMVKAEPNE